MCQAPFVCPKCSGWGIVYGGKCPVCNGERLVWPKDSEELHEQVTAITESRPQPSTTAQDLRLRAIQMGKRKRIGKGRPRKVWV